MSILPPTLTESDLRVLAQSWIPPELANAAGLRRVTSSEGAHLVGRNGAGDYSGIAIPYRWPGLSDTREYRLRRDHPKLELRPDGTTREKGKYLSPPGRGNMLYFAPGTTAAALTHTSLPVVICEGEKKVLALSRLLEHWAQLVPVGLPGVWNWRGNIGREAGPDGSRRAVMGPIADLSRITWQDRTVYIIFDSDKQRNPSIRAAERELARELKARGSVVRIVDIPDLSGLQKTGADDFLAHPEGGPERMLELIKHGRCLDSLSINAADQDLDRATRAAWDALMEANNPTYMFRHGTLARIEQDENGTPVIRELNLDRVRYELARCARYYVNVKDKKGNITGTTSANPPISVCKNILATPDPPFPALTRIVEVPVFASDCTLQLEPGYNAASRTYYAPDPVFNLPDVPEKPTREELLKARALIDFELLNDFPFASEAEKTNAVGLYILPYVRDLISGPTPLHLIEKPCQGTGASLLADAISYPAIGRSMAATTEGRDEDEWRKRLTAKLAAGPSFVLFDNLRRRLDSANVSAAITATSWEDRRLGYSETILVPIRCAWIATGNNPTVSGEIARRTVRIRLNAMSDRPWLGRSFKHPDLRGWMREKRGDLVWAALVLVRTWIIQGRPKAPAAVQRLGMFESWTEVIGGILAVAKYEGFLSNLEEFYQVSDTETAAWRGFVEEWWVKFGSNEVGVSDLFPLADDMNLGDGKERSQKTRLGILLRAARDRQFGYYRISLGTKRQGAQLFHLVNL